MKTAELQSSRNKSSWKWSSSEGGAAEAAQLQEKAQSREGPGHEVQEPKDTVLSRAAEGAPMAWGHLGSQACPQPSVGGERLPVPHPSHHPSPADGAVTLPLATALLGKLPTWAGSQTISTLWGQGENCPLHHLQHGAYECPRAEEWCPSSVVTHSWWQPQDRPCDHLEHPGPLKIAVLLPVDSYLGSWKPACSGDSPSAIPWQTGCFCLTRR